MDSNASSVKTQITSYLGTVRIQATSWEPYSAFDRHNSGEVFVMEYVTAQLVNGRTFPNLIAYEYVHGNSTVTYYYDSLTAIFPIKIVTEAGTFTVELTLASTNQG